MNIEDFKTMPLGTGLFMTSAYGVKRVYFGGLNPKDENLIMLINARVVNVITSYRLGIETPYKLCTSYEEALNHYNTTF